MSGYVTPDAAGQQDRKLRNHSRAEFVGRRVGEPWVAWVDSGPAGGGALWLEILLVAMSRG
jgi:hypothetical protein